MGAPATAASLKRVCYRTTTGAHRTLPLMTAQYDEAASVLAGYARKLADRARWSVANRTLESDLRSDLALILLPYALDEAGVASGEIRQEGTGRAGRFDSMFGTLLLEYKRPQLLRSPPERLRAATQAVEYLEDRALGARAVVVTDGETCGFLREITQEVEVGEQAALNLGEPASLPADRRFAWRPFDEPTAAALLSLLSAQRATPVNPRAVIAHLGPGRKEVLDLIALMSTALRSRRADGRSDTLLRQWVRSAGIAYGIESASSPWPKQGADRLLPPAMANLRQGTYAEAIFVLHTYVAFAAKTIAAEVLALQNQAEGQRPSGWAMLSDDALVQTLLELESGTLSEQLGAPGLLASDLFDWYAHEAGSSYELRVALRGVLEQHGSLAWARIAQAGGVRVDLLRELYQSVVPPALRKALGEFFTPRWLAEAVLERALELHGHRDGELPRILDPTCGSGSFLVARLSHGLAQMDAAGNGQDAAALTALLDSITGIDINPVATIMARVNLLLTLGDRATLLPEVTLNVFQADAIVMPYAVSRPTLEQSGSRSIVPTAAGDFEVASCLLDRRRMAVLRANLEFAIQRGLPKEAFADLLQAGLTGLSGEDLATAISSGQALFDRLSKLKEEDRDDVWARVIEQAIAPMLLRDVDLVVGNPPWISWKDLPTAWKTRSEPLWRAFGLWQRRPRGGGVPLSDLSALLLARAITTYAPNGTVAMLVPQSAVLADPGGTALRGSRLRPEPADRQGPAVDVDVTFRVEAMDDFVALNPFSPDASNKTVALYLRPNQEPVFPLPERHWRRRGHHRLPKDAGWPQVKSHLISDNRSRMPVNPNRISSPWGYTAVAGGLTLRTDSSAPYAFGRGYESRGLDGLFLYRVHTPRPDAGGLIRVSNLPEAGRNTAGQEPRSGTVEAALWWPLVKGEDVDRWRVKVADRYVLVAYHSGKHPKQITAAECRKLFPRTYRYLEPWTQRFLDRSMYLEALDENFPWALSGPLDHLSAEGALVFVRYLASGGKPAAAVCEPWHDKRLGRTTLPLPNNKSNIYYASNLDEAHFIAAFINSPAGQEALGRFAVDTGVTPAALQRLPMPRYDAREPSHRALANLGRRGGLAGDSEELSEQLDVAVHDVAA